MIMELIDESTGSVVATATTDSAGGYDSQNLAEGTYTVRQQIRDDTGLVGSVGLAPNNFLAKIAGDLKNLMPGSRGAGAGPSIALSAAGGLPVSPRPTRGAFERLRSRTIGQLRHLPPESLRWHFGQQVEHFRRLAHGSDDQPVVPDRQAKSLSHETTFAEDIAEIALLR